MVEVTHRVSKEATEQFWRLANSMFHRLYVAKGNVGKKIPQFDHIRTILYDNETPTVNLEIGYKSKEGDEVTIVKATTTPVSRFPPSTYNKLYEIASVDVS